jgi:hypothetical protein
MTTTNWGLTETDATGRTNELLINQGLEDISFLLAYHATGIGLTAALPVSPTIGDLFLLTDPGTNALAIYRTVNTVDQWVSIIPPEGAKFLVDGDVYKFIAGEWRGGSTILVVDDSVSYNNGVASPINFITPVDDTLGTLLANTNYDADSGALVTIRGFISVLNAVPNDSANIRIGDGAATVFYSETKSSGLTDMIFSVNTTWEVAVAASQIQIQYFGGLVAPNTTLDGELILSLTRI